ncbi:MAG: Nif3-like dinuclear metal center hexameric protein [Bacteroidetes bacterium]|nr:Nif3-like dinuclear metal center hexameric protein [Bacteroidota bacterium]
MKIKEIISCIENFAPLRLQELYDNSGLIIGDPEDVVSKALICIDVTEEVVNEAIKGKYDLIISHHPLIFGGIKKISKSDLTGKCIIKAINNNIAIYAAHTNLDNILDGVNSILCQKIGLKNFTILKPQKNILKKLVTYCPADKADKVRNALFEAGAGHIGNYDCCSFNTAGSGTFKALENSKPYVGKINKLHFENEVKIETVYPVFLEKKLLSALFESHPYEEVAYDIYSIENEYKKAGSGLVGEFEKQKNTKDFLIELKNILKIGAIRHTKITNKHTVKKVAICGGAGSFLINDAIAAGADIFLTSDLKYHNFFEANDKMVIADIGHFESEQFAKEILIKILNKKISTFAVQISKVNTNPICYL